MKKIATPQDLQVELRRLLASCQGSERPSREKLAEELRALATGVMDRRAGIQTPHGEPTRQDLRLVQEIQKHIKGVGKVIYVDYRGPDWSVLVDTEYAALKVFYVYRGSVEVKKANGAMGGWLIQKF